MPVLDGYLPSLHLLQDAANAMARRTAIHQADEGSIMCDGIKTFKTCIVK